MPRSLNFQDALNAGQFDEELLACETVSESKGTPSVKRELDIRKTVTDITTLLRGKLNSNELRLRDVCQFHLELMGGSHDNVYYYYYYY